MKLVFRRYVERELERAASWYEERRHELRADFLEEVGTTLSRIQGNPRLYPLVHMDIHRAPVRRFPYGVFYTLIGDEIHVLAVVHDARHPSVWRLRR